MGLMDRVKAQANQIAQMTQDAAQEGRAKIDQAQASRRGDALLRQLGVLVFADRTGRGTADSQARIEQLISEISAHEAQNGLNLSEQPQSPFGQSSSGQSSSGQPQPGQPAGPPQGRRPVPRPPTGGGAAPRIPERVRGSRSRARHFRLAAIPRPEATFRRWTPTPASSLRPMTTAGRAGTRTASSAAAASCALAGRSLRQAA